MLTDSTRRERRRLRARSRRGNGGCRLGDEVGLGERALGGAFLGARCSCRERAKLWSTKPATDVLWAKSGECVSRNGCSAREFALTLGQICGSNVLGAVGERNGQLFEKISVLRSTGYKLRVAVAHQIRTFHLQLAKDVSRDPSNLDRVENTLSKNNTEPDGAVTIRERGFVCVDAGGTDVRGSIRARWLSTHECLPCGSLRSYQVASR
jgi:hypothetical protein